MKKNYKNYGIILGLCCALNSVAQISGVVTINSGAVTGGTNYQSFNALRTALVTSGISGPVTVNVVAASGPYNEQVDFPAIAGANGLNTITFNGNGCVLTFNSSSSAQPWTLGLNGADYMTFNNLNIEGLGSTYALTCHLWNAADNNTFNNCTITAPQSSGNSSAQVPLSLSGSGTSATSAGNAGNNNLFNACLMSGGYYSTVFYTWTTSPFNSGNNVIDCTLRDFYYMGFYNYYHRNFIFRGNTIERPFQGATTTTYGIYLNTQSYGALIEGNKIHKMFESLVGSTSTTYGMYLTASVAGSVNVIQNNIISLNKGNGTTYAMYLPTGNYYNVFHNTISMGDNFTAGGGTIRGIWSTGGTSTSINNNIVSITHPGTGTKHCLYYTIATISSNFNDLHISGGGSNNFVGYWAGNQATLINWQAANSSLFDQASWSTDPLFASPPFSNFTPGSNIINNGGTNLGVANDYYNSSRGSTPDPGAIEFFNTNCVGVPPTGTVIVPSTTICPGATVLLGIPNSYTASGYSFQWQVSNMSAFGPFTTVVGATNQYITTPPINSQVWYNVVATCIGGTSVALSSGQLSVVPTVTSSVPYFEGFEGITNNNNLPNCSWAVSNGVNCPTYASPVNGNRVPRTGSKFAAFYYNPGGTNYFYTNGIELLAGITYSASVWYISGYSNYPDWGNITISVGPNQSPTGQVTIASQVGSVVNPSYASLSNTFQVASSGLYYVAIKAVTQSGYGYYPYLSWDDLSITIPCAANPVAVAMNSSTTTICEGDPVTLTASGANSYLWSNGQTTSVITVTPSSNSSYFVTGSSTLTGCSSQGTPQLITVNPSPIVSIIANNPVSCAGKPVNLQAVGNADTYVWANGPAAALNIVSPTASTTYSVIGTNIHGCTKQSVYSVTVNPLPTITASYPSEICAGEQISLNGSGGVSYVWVSNSVYLPTNPAIVVPNTTTTYTLTGTNSNGCSNTTLATILVDPCVGLKEASSLVNSIKVYPNPAHSEFNVELAKGSIQTLEVTDISGRVVLTANGGQMKATLNISSLSNGVYYVNIKTNENIMESVKMVKH